MGKIVINLGCVAGFDIGYLKSLHSIGCKSVEMVNDNLVYSQFNKVYWSSEIKDLGMKISSIEVNKSRNGLFEIYLGSLDDDLGIESIKTLKETVDIAEKICDVEVPKIIIRLKGSIPLERAFHEENLLKYKDALLKDTERKLNMLLNYIEAKQYRSEICVKNVVGYDYYNSASNVVILGAHCDAARLVDRFSNKHLKTCFDVGNALADINISKLANPGTNLNIKDFIASFADNVGHIHFNYAKGIGLPFLKSNSLIFDEDEDLLLDKILKLFVTYGYFKASVVLNIEEDSTVNGYSHRNYILMRDKIISKLDNIQ